VLVPTTVSRTLLPTPLWKIPIPTWLVLGFVLLATFCLKLHNLDHTGLTRWDEVYHAVVAQNLLKHPFKPTLVDSPYLPYQRMNWNENHVWLHKPILPFWQIAFSFAVLGVNTLALRLPSAFLSTGAAWLTYLIGKQLLDRAAALVAAALQAANPFLMSLIHGYQFADAVDVALLFWVEFGIYFLVCSLQTGSWGNILLAGVAQGLAYLCKSYLAAIIFGIALTAWLLPICRLARRENCRIDLRRLLGLLGATLLTVAPWLIYCLISYPEEFWHEDAQVWKHLNSNIENWAAPWDRVVFDYLIVIYGVFYTPILVAAIVLFPKTVTQRHTGLWLIYAWGLGVVLPHLAAVTKTPSATVIGMPALLLLLGYLVSEAWRGAWGLSVHSPALAGKSSLPVSPAPLAALTAVLTMSVLFPAVIKPPGYGYPSLRAFGEIMRHSMWVIHHVTVALAVALVVAGGWFLLRRWLLAGGGVVYRFVRMAALVYCLGVMVWLGIETVSAAVRVTDANVNDASYMNAGLFARDNLPDQAVLLCEESRGYEHLVMMFYADRTCYALRPNAADEMAHQVNQAGGIPYIVSYRKLPFPSVFESSGRGPTVYQWQPR
jgi:4-amino-4-deoxy-L-arabinose transferase-like glycosyltransferase